MRMFFVMLSFVVLGLSAVADGQSEDADVYAQGTVKFELAMRTGGKQIVHSWTQKRLQVLGDRVSIAVIKILKPADFDDPQVVRDVLPIIRDSFSEPQLISSDVDKEPKVTLVLLGYLHQRMDSHIEAQRDIEEVTRFVTSIQSPPHLGEQK
jgi:serine/threonine-protein kinase RIO1